jgi:HAD superfamily hydrolase (TIGR01549 family)
MKKEEKYKAIIFDLDGTLINSLPYHILAFKDLLLEHNIRIDEEHLKKLVGLSTKNILEILRKKYHFKENIADLREERRYHYFKFIGRRDITFKGVQKLLENLRLNYRLAIATGSSRVTLTHSTDTNFQRMFDEIVTINDVKKGKPSPDQLLKISKKFKLKSSECLVLGDSIYDCIAAKRARMDCFAVLTGYTSRSELEKNGAKKILKNVTELTKILN